MRIKRDVWLGVGFSIVLAGLVFGWGLLNARATPYVRTATIGFADWPANTPPIKVALLSDIHIGGLAMDQGRLARIVGQTNALAPDLVLLAGDFVIGHSASGIGRRAAQLTAPLASLRPRLGTIAVLGNHDYWTNPQRISSALWRAGVSVLDNQAQRAGPIVIAGVGDAFSGHDRPMQTLEAARRLSGPVVVLTHSPDLSPRLPSDVRLVMAGHTHCGQIMFPWGQPLSMHSPLAGGRRLYDPKYRCGLIRDQGREVVVTAGVGSGTAPIRFGAPPDIWILTLGPGTNLP
jgi:predicted MPP superfamily phosphohydrolase